MPESIERAIQLHDEALAFQAAGQHGEAESRCHSAIGILEAIDGPDSPDVANVLNTLAESLEAQGKYREAEEQARRAISILDTLGGVVDAGDAARIRIQSCNVIGTAYRAQARYSEAETLFQQGLTMAET